MLVNCRIPSLHFSLYVYSNSNKATEWWAGTQLPFDVNLVVTRQVVGVSPFQNSNRACILTISGGYYQRRPRCSIPSAGRIGGWEAEPWGQQGMVVAVNEAGSPTDSNVCLLSSLVNVVYPSWLVFVGWMEVGISAADA